jgi:hypothetical protein
MKSVVNILIYQAIWFFSVLGGDLGALAGGALIIIHLYFSRKRVFDLWMMASMLTAGLVIDGTLHQIGFYSFAVSGFPIPFWLAVVWLGLAITPGHSLAWMQHKPVLCAVFGFLGGPAAYWGGVRLGAAQFNWPLPLSLLVIAVLWAFLWPLMMALSTVFEKYLEKRARRRNRHTTIVH